MRTELIRFGAVIVAGLLIDLSISLLLVRSFDVDLQVAAAIGFVVALTFNYFLFEFWVFMSAARAVSPARFLMTGISAMAALGARLSVIGALRSSFGTQLLEQAALLLCAAAVSAGVNYLLVRIVFTRSRFNR